MRLIKIGDLKTGINNNICDVKGVSVGHVTIKEGNTKTGITAILPHSGNLFKEKVVAGSYVFNGFGKSVGLMQIDELGNIESPILLTNTLNVGKVMDGLISYMIKSNPDIGKTTSTINSVVLECNDGSINDIQNRVLNEEHVYQALENTSSNFQQGNVGAGTGMKCHGFKGGIGSSSRVVSVRDEEFSVGVLVNSNFGSSNGKDLIIKGRRMGELIKNYNHPQEEDKGSIIVVIATDAPLDTRQLRRLCKRAEIGIGRTGSYAGNGSGDIMVAFTTKNIITHDSKNVCENIIRYSDDYINPLFKAVVEATEEAVLNSMLNATSETSYNGKVYKSLNEYQELFKDLLENN